MINTKALFMEYLTFLIIKNSEKIPEKPTKSPKYKKNRKIKITMKLTFFVAFYLPYSTNNSGGVKKGVFWAKKNIFF